MAKSSREFSADFFKFLHVRNKKNYVIFWLLRARDRSRSLTGTGRCVFRGREVYREREGRMNDNRILQRAL